MDIFKLDDIDYMQDTLDQRSVRKTAKDLEHIKEKATFALKAIKEGNSKSYNNELSDIIKIVNEMNNK